MDGEGAPPPLMLIARDVDAVDAVAMIAHALASELVAKPRPHPQVAWAYAQPEAVALVVRPTAFIVAAIGSSIEAVPPCLASSVHHAGIEAHAIDAHTTHQRVGLEPAYHQPALGIAHQSLAMRMQEGVVERHAPLRKIDGHGGVAALGIARHHVEALVNGCVALHVVAYLGIEHLPTARHHGVDVDKDVRGNTLLGWGVIHRSTLLLAGTSAQAEEKRKENSLHLSAACLLSSQNSRALINVSHGLCWNFRPR